MLKYLMVISTIAVSAFSSANAFAWSRAEVWMMKNKGGVHRDFYVADDSSGSAAGYQAAEKDLQSRGEDKPELTPEQAASLAQDCITQVEDNRRVEEILIELGNAVTLKVFDKTAVEALKKLTDHLSAYDARQCYRRIESQGHILPNEIQRRYFPERFPGGSSGGSGPSPGGGCGGGGGCGA